jgi:hypothetical protein
VIASTKERRRSPRAESNIPLKISCEDFDIVTESKNLSASGACCTVNQYLEPMTKLKIQLLLPCKTRNKLTPKKISCHGVVVRTQAHTEDKNFAVAIYFNEIQEKDRKLITDHIASFLKEKSEGC